MRYKEGELILPRHNIHKQDYGLGIVLEQLTLEHPDNWTDENGLEEIILDLYNNGFYDNIDDVTSQEHLLIYFTRMNNKIILPKDWIDKNYTRHSTNNKGEA